MKILISFLFCLFSFNTDAQPIDSNAVRHAIDSINRLIDRSVVNKQLTILNKHYAEDFYFKHGSGKIDSKKSWIENIQKPATAYTLRNHDSVTIELHKDIAIVSGTLEVDRPAGRKKGRYFRVYVLRKKVWQLLSHNTIYEWDIKSALSR